MEILLVASAGVAAWLAFAVRRRRRTPGSSAFLWLLLAVAVWSCTGVAHRVVPTLDAKIAWAVVQYVGIASVPPLWLMFALQFAGSPWTGRPRNLALLWVVPVLTVAAAATNEVHGALWTSVVMTDGGMARYGHGWFFWIAAAFNYVLMLVGSVSLVRALRRSPLPFRGQFAAVLAAAFLPWAGNLAYLAGLLPAGVDATPLMFAVSGLLFTWALFRNHLFELVPVARDQLVESLVDAVVVIDASRRVLDLNAAALRYVAEGRRASHWLGRRVDDLMPFLEGMPLTSGVTPGASFTATHGPYCFDVRVTPVRGAASRPMAWAVLLRDVTAQRTAALEREALEIRVHEQQKRESLSVLAGGLAHDFNNLLAGIIGNADLLALRVTPSSEMGSHVGAILLGAQRAADLVSKMLAYAGERHGASGPVDLDALSREMLDLLRASVARHCALRYQGRPVEIFADAVQIRQVAMNLIINASEAVEEGTGIIDIVVGSRPLSAVDLGRMRFGHDIEPGTYAFIDVRDNGSGMDDTTLRRIFTPFYTTKHAGHGLGLAAVEGIVRGHRGALDVESRVGTGTRVTAWFPVCSVADRQSRAERPVSPSAIS